MTVALEQAAALHLGQAPQPFHLEPIDQVLQRLEVLFDTGVWLLGELLRSERVDDVLYLVESVIYLPEHTFVIVSRGSDIKPRRECERDGPIIDAQVGHLC